MTTEIAEFVVFPHDKSWKIYSSGELVAVYPTFQSAEADAQRFSKELFRRGRPTAIRILSPEEATVFVRWVVES